MDGKLHFGLRFVIVARRKVIFALVAAVLGAQDLAEHGASLMRTGRYAEAEAAYRQLLKAAPRHPGWEGNLGLALHSQGRFKEAADHLERSLKLSPSTGLATVLGLDYLKLGKPCQAVAPLRKTKETAMLADALSGCKRFAEAANLYEKLGDGRAAGRAYWQARDYPAALRVLRAVADKYGDEPQFNYEYGDSLLRGEGAKQAVPFLERAKELLPAQAALGKAYAELGRFKEAIPHLEAGAEADPDLLLPLSKAYKETGRAAEADRALKAYRSNIGQN
jgi:tetratricopeptide (TPR) repeat protein